MKLVIISVVATAAISFEVHQNLPSIGWERLQEMTWNAPRTPSIVAESHSEPVLPPPPVLVPVPIHPGIVRNSSTIEATAPLDIITQSGSNYYVKLQDANSGFELIDLYAVGGEKLSVFIPPGVYIMKYIYGSVWYGPRHYFGEDTVAKESDKVLAFRHGPDGDYGHVVTLIRQPNGNLPIHGIPLDQF